jgi:hypothetical protein
MGSWPHLCSHYSTPCHSVRELLPESTEGIDTETISDYDSAQLCLFLSVATAKGVESQKSMRLLGQI